MWANVVKKMSASNTNSAVNTIYNAAKALHSKVDLDHILDAIGNSKVVMIGEESHGTQEFYKLRADITKRLIEEKGFNVVACEADFPDAYRVNRYVRGANNSANARDAKEALADFQRFPLWMWRNTVVAHFVEWLKNYNTQFPNVVDRVGFYGMDLYSLFSSMEAVVKYLDKVDPGAAEQARKRYSCFDQFHEDEQSYGFSVNFGMSAGCERQVVAELKQLQEESSRLIAKDGFLAEDELFYAQHNALVVRNAENYYKAMFRGRNDSWNVRDSHMHDTVKALLEHRSRDGREAKAVVWAHNSHLGDARATEMGRGGEWNVGQLLRQTYGKDKVYNIGFSTHHGYVTAANQWDEPAHHMKVRPSLEESYEHLLHRVTQEHPNTHQVFAVIMRSNNPALPELQEVRKLLKQERLERAIGVIYKNQSATAEKLSHYFNASLSEQFDCVIHVDHTKALHPLDKTAHWTAPAGMAAEHHDNIPETYPFGL